MEEKRKTRRFKSKRNQSNASKIDRFIRNTTISGLSNRPVYSFVGKVSGYVISTNGSGTFTSPQIDVNSTDFLRTGGSGAGSLWDQVTPFTQWRLLKVCAKIRPLTDSPGVTFFSWTDFDHSSNPAGLIDARSLCLHNSYKVDERRSLVWKAADFADSDFTTIGASGDTIIYFSYYTNNGTYQAPISTSLFLLEFEVVLQVRGQDK
jgi:hypothetical protein